MEEGAHQRRLDELLAAEIDVQRCVVALRQGSIPHSSVVQMCTTITAKLQALSANILDLELDLQGTGHAADTGAESMLQAVAQHKREVEVLREAMRTAALYHHRQNADQRTQSDRAELLGKWGPSSGQGGAPLDTDATASLRRARGLLSRELERSADTMRLLDEGSEKLRHTHAEYQAHRGALASSVVLLNRLAMRVMADAVFVYFAFAVYVFVCAYILSRRLF